MKITTKLKIIAALPFALALIIGFTIFLTSQQVHKAMKEERVLDAIAKGVFELNILTYEYLQHPEERILTQWQLKYNSLTTLITGIPIRKSGTEIILDRIRLNHEDLKSLFSQVVKNYEKLNAHRVDTDVSSALRERLIGQMLAKSQTMVSDASQLAESSNAEIREAHQRTDLLIVSFIILLALIIGATAFLISRSISRPITKLHEATEIIAGGNLDYEVDIKTRDETGQLCRSFNEMVHKLKKSYTDLEEEIVVRKSTEDALLENQERYRTVADFTYDWEYWRALDGKMLYTSPSCERITGYRAEEFIENPGLLETIVHPDDRQLLEQHKTVALGRDHVNGLHEVDFRILRRDGEVRWIGHTCQNIRRADGTNLGLRATNRDITERKLVEEALAQSERTLRAIFEGARDGILVVDVETRRFVVANEAICRMLGYSRNEILGLGLQDIHPGKDLPYVVKQLEQQIRGEISLATDIPVVRRDGSVFLTDVNSQPVELDGRPCVIGVFRDITERKRAEEEIRESEGKYRSLFEDSKDVVYISTIEGKFLDINPAGVALFGYDSKEELLKVDIAKDIYLNPYDRKKFIQTMEQQGFVKDYELLKKRRDGEILTLLSTTTPSRDKEGKIIEYHGIMRDVTHQRKLEQQLLHAQKMEAVGQLTGGIAHDFNNILTAIVGYSGLLQMKMSRDDPLRHNVDQILASSERAANLTQSLLAFSRKQIISLQPVTLNGIVKRVEKLLSRIISEDIELRTFLAREDLIVMADSGQIEQVLMNLATNARDAMPNGGSLTIETEIVELDEKYIKTHGYGEPGMYARISFTDTGEGMDKETKEKIFEPFFTTKEVGKGTGLGLSMVYGIVKQHNGYINVYSELGKGTTFKIYLPLTKKEVKEIKPTELAPLIGGTETVLLAEDDTDVRKFTKQILEEFGYTVIEAVDGGDAIDKFMENRDKIELLILDVVMPKKNGRGVYEEIKKTRPDIKVLFMSGYTANVIHKQGILEEGLDFVLKPILPTLLLRKIREVIDRDNE